MSSAASPNVHTIIYNVPAQPPSGRSCRHSNRMDVWSTEDHLPQLLPSRKVWVKPMEKNSDDILRLGSETSKSVSYPS